MPRDANGNYTLPAGNPVVTQTDIASTWANDTMSDIGSEMTDSLSRSGKGGMTGPFPIIDKQGNVPGLSFAAEPTSGLLREAAGDIRLAAQGTDKLRVLATAGDVQVWRNSTWNPVAIEPADRKVMYGEGGVTTIFHYGTTAAPGWAIEEPDANIRELVIGPSAGGGVIGGTQDPTNLSDTVNITINISGNTGDTILTSAQSGMPAHNVNFPGRASDGGELSAIRTPSVGLPQGDYSIPVAGQDAASGHNHAFSGSGNDSDTVTLTPRYARGLLMKLDA